LVMVFSNLAKPEIKLIMNRPGSQSKYSNMCFFINGEISI